MLHRGNGHKKRRFDMDEQTEKDCKLPARPDARIPNIELKIESLAKEM